MALLDVFNEDAFSVMSLTTAINKLPYVPSRVGRMGLFRTQPINTTTVAIEERHGQLSLLTTVPRGDRSQATTRKREKRQLRSFVVPHIPCMDSLLADSIQNVRAFGQESTTELFATVLNDKLARLRQDHEVTFEWHRIGAIKGHLLDGDGSTIYNWFTEFGITETEIAFDFADSGDYDNANPTHDMKLRTTDVFRKMQLALGGTPFTGIHALCGDHFFDAFVTHATVRRAYERYQDGKVFRELQTGQDAIREVGFEFGGITWENYRGFVGDQVFIEPDECRFVPIGVPDLFIQYCAPADYIETVNTMGQPVYAKQERMKFDKGIEIETQSNCLFVCTRPAACLKGVGSNFPQVSTTTTTTTGV